MNSEIDMMRTQGLDELAVVDFAVETFRGNRKRVDAAFRRGGEAGGLT